MPNPIGPQSDANVASIQRDLERANAALASIQRDLLDDPSRFSIAHQAQVIASVQAVQNRAHEVRALVSRRPVFVADPVHGHDTFAYIAAAEQASDD